MADQNSTQPKAQTASFSYKNTGMGGFEDSIIMSFRTGKPVKSALRRIGTHGTRYYRLFPGRYLLYKVWRSNSGNLYCNISIIRITEEGQEIEKEWEIVHGKEQKLQLDDLPQNIREILLENKDELPLFNRIFLINDSQEGE
jgi:hypothetical protein